MNSASLKSRLRNLAIKEKKPYDYIQMHYQLYTHVLRASRVQSTAVSSVSRWMQECVLFTAPPSSLYGSLPSGPAAGC